MQYSSRLPVLKLAYSSQVGTLMVYGIRIKQSRQLSLRSSLIWLRQSAILRSLWAERIPKTRRQCCLLFLLFFCRLHQRYTAVKYSNSGNMTARRKQAAPSTTTLTTTSCHPVSCDYDGFLRFHAPNISSTIPSQTACQYCPCPHCRDVTSSNISQPEIETPDDVIGLDISKPAVDNFQQTTAHTTCCVLEQSVRRPTELLSVAAEQNRHETTYCLPVITSGGLIQTDGEIDLTLRTAQMC
jgi:hypothetical protein